MIKASERAPSWIGVRKLPKDAMREERALRKPIVPVQDLPQPCLAPAFEIAEWDLTGSAAPRISLQPGTRGCVGRQQSQFSS
jgi:hypothetical protein